MKYELEIDIDLPRERVVELFDDPDNLKKWQPELVSFDHLDGEPGEPGARSRMVYKMGNKEVEMIETIATRNLPDAFSATYEAKGVHNRVDNRFIDLGDGRTRWLFETEFRFRGLMWLMSTLMPGMFRKQSLKFMQQFKDFAEGARD